MRRSPLGVFIILCTLIGCAPRSPPVDQSAAAISAPAHPLPPNIRPDLAKRWVAQAGGIGWPPNDGFSGAPTLIVLRPGMLIDRFGGDGGRFFSPKGAAFAARSLPYICETLPYVVYRVAQPVLAWAGRAAGWFDEPGGATTLETDAPVRLLISDHVIEPVAHSGPPPCP